MSNSKLLTNEQRELYSLMLPIYGAILTQTETSKVLKVSISTLYRMREQGVGAGYKKREESKNGTVVYPLHEIVRYLTESNVKTA